MVSDFVFYGFSLCVNVCVSASVCVSLTFSLTLSSVSVCLVLLQFIFILFTSLLLF